jgi:eukaryotic-like serine/threonine-protein kinase
MSDLRAADRGGVLEAVPGQPGLPAQFGPYEILGPLGAGGMGQVYRARDRRLQRNVAVKILHDTAALDPDRRRRFAQEAIAAGALNHPNILTVYDIGVEADTPYLVSELIDGVSLRSEMNKGRMPLRRLIDVALQIAEGLAAAHEAGIVHRDLKPENVMVTDGGRVKIVDFGLAKVKEGESEHSAQIAEPASMTQTADGLIVGTVPYMSPEQARGERADFRSDQFALGVMLYEMTTGAHPFRRETAVQTLSAIIADDPPEPPPTSFALPTALRWLIRRLLAKTPRERYAHTADLVADLRTIREYLSEATSSGISAVVPVRRWRWKLLAAVAAVFAGGAIVGRLGGITDTSVRFDKFTPLATDAGYQKNAVWSPDGRQIAYEAEVDGIVQIFTRTLESAMRTKITESPSGSYDPVWASDGYIYYHSQARDQDALWRVSPVGGEPQLMIEGARRSAISPDARTIVYLRSESAAALNVTLWIAAPPGSPPRRYARAPFHSADGLLRFSPDGSRLLVWFGGEGNGSHFREIAMPDGEPRDLFQGLGVEGQGFPFFSWLPDSRHVVVTRWDGPTPGTHLWVADTKNGSLVPITVTPGNESAPSVSPDGRTIAFTSESTDFDLVEVPLDGSSLRPFLSSTRNEYDPAVSPANTQYAFVTDRTGSQQIWLQNTEGYLQQVLVNDAAFGGRGSLAFGSLAFSPDGRRLAFQRAGAQSAETSVRGSRLWITSTSGGSPVPIGPDSITYQDAPTWSPDGEWIAYISGGVINKSGLLSLVKSRVGARTESVTVLKSAVPPFVARPQWSPDGASILCETNDGLTIIGADGTGARVISGTGWFAYAWTEDGRKIYGLRPTDDGHHFMLVSLDSRTGAEQVINTNLGTIPQALQPIRGFSRLRGGGFLTSIARVRSDIYLIEGFRLPQSWWRRLWPFGRGVDS